MKQTRFEVDLMLALWGIVVGTRAAQGEWLWAGLFFVVLLLWFRISHLRDSFGGKS